MKYRPEIDGLRAIAVLPVILFHAGFSSFRGGYVGVDVFFVISGYLITTIVLNDIEAGTFSFWNFYERRARRILPALFFVIICCIPFAWMWMMPAELKAFSSSVVAVVAFVSNILFWRQSSYFDQAAETKPLLHTWSLAVEEQYYIIFPVAMLILWRFGRRNAVWTIALVAIASFGLSEYCSRYSPSFNFYWLPTRAWELLAGALCALAVSRPYSALDNVLSFAGLAAIVVSIFYFDETTRFPSIFALFPVAGACTIILFAHQGTFVGSLLSFRVFVGTGLISYSAYLWHQPVFAFARIRSITEPTHSAMALLVIVTVLLAYLSWRFVELPIRKRGTWPVADRQAMIRLFTPVAALLVAFGLGGYFSKGLPIRLSEEVQTIAANAIDIDPNRHCISSPERKVAPGHACAYGNRSNVTFALLGDSHAHSIAFELSEELSALGFGMTELTHSGCPPIRLYSRTTENGFFDCDNYNKSALEYLGRQENIGVVLLFARWPLYAEFDRFDNGEGGLERGTRVLPDSSSLFPGSDLEKKMKVGSLYQSTISELVGTGKRVVVIYPQPEIGWDVPTYLSKAVHFEAMQNRPLSISTEKFKERSSFAYSQLDSLKSDQLLRVFPSEIFCDSYAKGRCVAEDGALVFYSDDNHLSKTGAAMLADVIVQKMQDNNWMDN